MRKVLVAEQDKTIRHALRRELYSLGCEILEADCLRQAYTLWKESSLDLILLAREFSDGSGVDFADTISRNPKAPGIILMGSPRESDGYAFLKLPFQKGSLAELLWPSEGEENGKEILSEGDMYFDFSDHIFRKGMQNICFSRTEQRVLKLLLENRGQIVSRELLLRQGWENKRSVDENTLCVVIRRLRKKLENNPGKPKYIQTVYGSGYMWAEHEEKQKEIKGV